MIPRERYRVMIGETSWESESRLTNAAKLYIVSETCRYQRAFVDFFEDQLVSKRYDWKLLLDEYLFQGKEPLINGLVSGRKYKTRKCRCKS